MFREVNNETIHWFYTETGFILSCIIIIAYLYTYILSEKQETIKLFYKNQMTGTYKMTEKEINKIITQNVKPNSDAKLKLFIYYKNKKLRQLFIKNNPQKSNESHHVIYKYTCDQAQCTAAHANYIGHTTTTLKERFKQHSSIKKHFQSIHKRNITGSEMMKNVEVLCRASDKRTLSILEALMIQKLKPLINLQVGDFNRTLKMFAWFYIQNFCIIIFILTIQYSLLTFLWTRIANDRFLYIYTSLSNNNYILIFNNFRKLRNVS